MRWLQGAVGLNARHTQNFSMMTWCRPGTKRLLV